MLVVVYYHYLIQIEVVALHTSIEFFISKIINTAKTDNILD